MQTSQVIDFARKLRAAQGPAAESLAAQRAEEFTRRQQPQEAEIWRRVEAVLRENRGPRQT